ncbi:ras GEF [Coprinellus micaceus]|uniref:Ras GEF n=1 Tax=Coprinellus micaceus TaxID=71717 RepID=A0A4Y7TPJ7_COPMI|nr:ras GEF [Coprinellus micaceus]
MQPPQNNQIIQWIKQSLLHWDALQQRAGVLKFYISTAQNLCSLCSPFFLGMFGKLRNYHSLIAIAIALGSTPVMSLELTREFLSDKQMAQYEELVQLTDPEGNHYRYRRALKEVIDPAYADFCIPWIAVHLKELHLVLHANKRADNSKKQTTHQFPTVHPLHGQAQGSFGILTPRSGAF